MPFEFFEFLLCFTLNFENIKYTDAAAAAAACILALL